MEILDGVKLGDQVALTDVDNLADGTKVVVGGGADAKRGSATPANGKTE
jgi:hypothetical protein